MAFENPISRFSVVLDRDYARLWGIGVATSSHALARNRRSRSLRLRTDRRSAFLVGFVGFLRMAPMLFLGAFIGALSDRVNRRVVLGVANITLASVYLTLGLLIVTDRIELWQISVGALFSGVVWATDFPVRRAMIADIVPPDRVSSAFGVDMASSNFSRVIGPIVGGAFLQTIGMQAVYFLGMSLFIVASTLAFSMLLVRKPITPTARTPVYRQQFRLEERRKTHHRRLRPPSHHHHHRHDEPIRLPLPADGPRSRCRETHDRSCPRRSPHQRRRTRGHPSEPSPSPPRHSPDTSPASTHTHPSASSLSSAPSP